MESIHWELEYTQDYFCQFTVQSVQAKKSLEYIGESVIPTFLSVIYPSTYRVDPLLQGALHPFVHSLKHTLTHTHSHILTHTHTHSHSHSLTHTSLLGARRTEGLIMPLSWRLTLKKWHDKKKRNLFFFLSPQRFPFSCCAEPCHQDY